LRTCLNTHRISLRGGSNNRACRLRDEYLRLLLATLLQHRLQRKPEGLVAVHRRRQTCTGVRRVWTRPKIQAWMGAVHHKCLSSLKLNLCASRAAPALANARLSDTALHCTALHAHPETRLKILYEHSAAKSTS
jgi:hypothetical protein